MLQNLPEEGLGKEVERCKHLQKKLSGVCDWFGQLFSQSDVFKAIIIILIICIPHGVLLVNLLSSRILSTPLLRCERPVMG